MQVFSHLMKRQQAAGNCSPEGSLKVGEPYSVDGIRYEPVNTSYQYKERGIASWYGSDFHGRATANGECYNMYAYTAAHKTLPMPTVVRVTNLENNKSIVLKVNDRGPFVRGRLIDLSYAAAQSLDIVRMGSAPVLVEAIEGPFHQPGGVSPAVLAAAQRTQAGPGVEATATPSTQAEELPALDAQAAGVPPPTLPQSLPVPPAHPASATLPLYNTRVYVQVGAFAETARAETVHASLKALETTAHTGTTSTATGQVLTRVRSGPYATIELAQEALSKLAPSFPDAQIVVEK